jgi:hypothetical protein
MMEEVRGEGRGDTKSRSFGEVVVFELVILEEDSNDA